MLIERLEVEEGFLDGLNLEFRPGLNVLIGPRGCGKTSVVELLRFALSVPGYTDKSDAGARQHALSVLGSGRVTTTVSVNGDRVVFSRSASDPRPRISSPTAVELPIILSQNEIEALGLDANGRLRILDSFRPGVPELTRSETAAMSLVGSLTVEMHSLSRELQDIQEQLQKYAAVANELQKAEREEAEIVKSSASAKPDQERLANVGKSLAARSVRRSVYERSVLAIQSWQRRLDQLVTAPPSLEQWPRTAISADPLGDERGLLAKTIEQVRQASAGLTLIVDRLQDRAQSERSEEAAEEDQARALRRSLNELVEGTSAVTRRVAELRKSASESGALGQLSEEKMLQLRSLQASRHSSLDELDRMRNDRFEQRNSICQELVTQLGPRIRISVNKAGLHTGYSNAISSALRGSGLHYNTLAPMLAARLSPRELVEAIERSDTATISSIGDITPDRAARLIAHVQAAGTEAILTAEVEDSVEFSLLDGQSYKPTEQLSTGQRCTVLLPILLRHLDRALIVDQPEDHLDNAFIVDTVIQAISDRPPRRQLVFVTHNANIPVLGEAERVVQLASDGRRGFVRHAGNLDDPVVVDAIASIMEGGREAFERRANFYRSRP